MRTCSTVTFSLLALLAHGAQAQQAETAHERTAEIELSNNTLQLRYIGGERKHSSNIENSRVSAAFFLSEQRDIVFFGDLMFPADLNLGALTITFGPRLYASLLEGENNDVMALSLGTELRFDLHRSRGLALVGHAFYAPDILTFGSADSVSDLGARVEMRLAPRLTGFAGMRWFEFDLNQGQGKRTLQKDVIAGFGWRF